MAMTPVTKALTMASSRNAADSNHSPQAPCAALLFMALGTKEEVELVTERDDNRHSAATWIRFYTCRTVNLGK